MAYKGSNSDVTQELLSLRDVLLSAVSAESTDSGDQSSSSCLATSDFENGFFNGRMKQFHVGGHTVSGV